MAELAYETKDYVKAKTLIDNVIEHYDSIENNHVYLIKPLALAALIEHRNGSNLEALKIVDRAINLVDMHGLRTESSYFAYSTLIEVMGASYDKPDILLGMLRKLVP